LIVAVYRSTSAQMLTDNVAGSCTSWTSQQPPETPTTSKGASQVSQQPPVTPITAKRTATLTTEAASSELTLLQLVLSFPIVGRSHVYVHKLIVT
jgi:hypothetical protein